MKERYKEEQEESWKELQAEILEMEANPVEITDEYNDILF